MRIARFAVVLAVVPLVAVTLAGCAADEHTPRGVAERFLDAHYVNIDLAAAREYCAGLALHKVEEEQRLTRGQAIDETTRKPRVRYRLLDERRAAEGETRFVYEGTITVPDADRFTRQWLLTVRRDGGTWKVTNYQEYE